MTPTTTPHSTGARSDRPASGSGVGGRVIGGPSGGGGRQQRDAESGGGGEGEQGGEPPRPAGAGQLELLGSGDRQVDLAGGGQLLGDLEPRVPAPHHEHRSVREGLGVVVVGAVHLGHRLYFDHVLQANQGADLDFLVGASGHQPPRHNH
jgi:hypothetical protein